MKEVIKWKDFLEENPGNKQKKFREKETTCNSEGNQGKWGCKKATSLLSYAIQVRRASFHSLQTNSYRKNS